MARFYYRPIDPGYDRVGAALAGGANQGLRNFEAGRDRQRHHQREDQAYADQQAEGERQRTRQDGIDDQNRALFEAQWMQMGGGRGTAPTTPWTPEDVPGAPVGAPEPPGAPEMRAGDLFGPAAYAGSPSMVTGLDGRPEAPAVTPMMPGSDWLRNAAGVGEAGTTLPRLDPQDHAVQVADPDYAQITPDRYLLRPEVAAGREAEGGAEALAAEHARDEAEINAIAEVLMHRDPEMPPELARQHAEVYTRDPVGGRQFLSGASAMPERGTPEYSRMLYDENYHRATGTREGRGPSGGRGARGGGGGASLPTPTYEQAFRRIEEMDEGNMFVNTPLSPEQKHRMAQQWSGGEEVDWDIWMPPEEDLRAVVEEGEGEAGLLQRGAEWLGGRISEAPERWRRREGRDDDDGLTDALGGEGAAGQSDAAGEGAAELDTAALDRAWREIFRHRPQRGVRDDMRQAGYSEAEIEHMMRARR